MSTEVMTETTRTIVYPESDGQLMADNTRQFRWAAQLRALGIEPK